MRRLAAFSLAALAGASAAGASGQPVFHSGVDLVTVPVTVITEGRSKAPPALTLSDIRILEDGQPQTPSLVELDTRPLSIAIVLDQSRSMVGPSRDWSAEAMKGILKALRPTDEVTLVAFGGWPLVPVSWTHVAGLDGFDWAQWVVSPETSLLDAVGASIEMMDLRSGGHGAVLVLSDGLEVSSSISLSSVVRSRRQSETELYAFKFDPAWDAEGRRRFPQWFPRAGVTPPANHYLEQLVGDSGGVVYTISNEDAVAAMVKEFVKTLTGQFLVGYTSTKPLDGKYRRIKVEPTRRDLKLRHRGGYLAVPLAQ